MKDEINNIKEMVDLPTLFGIVTALYRAMKEKLSWRETILQMFIAGLLCYGGVELVILFFPNVSAKAHTFIGALLGYFVKETLEAVKGIFPLLNRFAESKMK